jgi:crooked neck
MKASNQAKNRAPAPIQITSEQLLREAKERGLEDVPKQPKQFITDKEELLQYQNAKRKDFEDQIRRNRHHIGIWCRYGLWEATLKEFERSRSVFERALSEFEKHHISVDWSFKSVPLP